MTVEDLKYYLGSMPDDMEVMIHYTYPDHWRSEICGPIDEVETAQVHFSDYHNTEQVGVGDDGESKTVVLLGRVLDY